MAKAKRLVNGAGLGALVITALVGCRGEPGKTRAPDPSAPTPTAAPSGAPDASVAQAPARATDLATRPELAVWSLVDNRAYLHGLYDGGLLVDAQAPAFERYQRAGFPSAPWQAVTVDGVVAARATKLAAIEVPLTAAQAAATEAISARVWAARPGRLSLKINGRAVAAPAVTVQPGWQTVAFPAAGRVQVGENHLAFAGPVTLAWLATGAPHTALALPTSRITPATRTVDLDARGGVAWYQVVPEGAHLIAPVQSAEPCRVEVEARSDAGAMAGGLLGGDRARVDLSALAGRAARIELRARDCAGGAQLVDPRVTVPGLVTPPTPASPPRYVVLWVMDALRADRIGAFTPGARAQTPTLDRLAQTGAVFRQFYVQGNESQTSHASLWTGLYPARHGVRSAGNDVRHRMDKAMPGIGERLRDLGLEGHAVTGNGFVTDYGGYARGFTSFRNMMGEKGVVNGILLGRDVVDAALTVFGKHRAKPLLFFLGTVDNHGPWIARKPWIDIYSPPPYDGPFKDHGTFIELGIVRGQMGCQKVPPPRDVERLRAIYDSAISYQDQQLGRFVEQLQAWGIWDDTLLIITADHGEELFEESRCGHGASLRETLLRVPLLMHYPKGLPGGTVVTGGAESVDVVPTVLELLGGAPDAALQGRSLVPLVWGAERGLASPSVSSQYEYAHAMRIGRYKARVGKTGVPLLFDLVDDPDERTDIAGAAPIARRLLADALGVYLPRRARWAKASWGPVNNLTPAGAAAIDAEGAP